MATARGLINQDDLPAFQQFIEARGWVVKSTKGAWEVLRANRTGNVHPLLVYKRLNTDELTTSGVALTMARAFVKANNHTS